jgi:hypothetical protein
MNWIPSKLGPEKKKVAILAVLLVVAGYFFISSMNSGSTVSATRTSPGTSPVGTTRITARPSGRARVIDRGTNNGPREFRPSLKSKDLDPSGIDPTLHLQLLASLRGVQLEGGSRSLFELSTPPVVAVAVVKEPEKIKPTPVGPMLPPPPPPPPPDPKAPPIPLKFYGFVNPAKADPKRAFFLDGEDIIIAGEGDVIKKHYKIVRIGINSAVVEDTEFKSNNQQTLPLEAEMAG